MPYLLLALALILALYGLTRFILAANARQVIALALSALILAVTVALFLLALTGRLPAALALLAALWPIGAGLWVRYKRGRTGKNRAGPPPAPGGNLTRAEALAILGLPETADENAIRTAHKTLIMKLHPDQDGSAWLATRINQARDTLLG